jgi:hypothetical protein
MEKLSRQRKSRSERHCPIIFFRQFPCFLLIFLILGVLVKNGWRTASQTVSQKSQNAMIIRGKLMI